MSKYRVLKSQNVKERLKHWNTYHQIGKLQKSQIGNGAQL